MKGLSVLMLTIVGAAAPPPSSPAAGAVKGDNNPNILFISLSDIGLSDFGSFGTLNFDSYIDSSSKESIFLGSHYVSYQDSSSLSQLMTGIHSYHSGFGTLGVSTSSSSTSFGHGMIGGIPQSYGLLSEYLKSYGNYDTSYVGPWGLGSSINEQLPNSRGFDYFYGSYTNENDVMTKKSSLERDSLTIDPSIIRNDKTEYYDFWENDKIVDFSIAKESDSNNQFSEKVISLLKEDRSSSSSSSPFYIHLSFQGPTQYMSSSNMEYSSSITKECNKYSSNNARKSMCEYMLHLDLQFGKIMSSIKNDENNLWENTLIVVAGTNGGIQSSGSCNYPYRGGKNTFLDGNARSVAFITGGAVSKSSNLGSSLDGLFSNVDWLPTILSFTNILDGDVKHVREFDGINQESYIMGTTTNGVSIRDHVMLHISPYGFDNFGVYDESTSSDNYKREWGWSNNDGSSIGKQVKKIHQHDSSSSSNEYTETLNEIAMVFYDDNGKLWKYFVIDDVWDNENRYGTITDKENMEYNWCVSDGDNSEITNVDFSKNYGVLSGLFELSNDKSEQLNLLTTISQSEFTKLKTIVMEKADFYINSEYSERATKLYSSFDCFFERKNIAAYPGTLNSNGVWMPFLNNLEEYVSVLEEECGLVSSHGVYSVHANSLSLSIDDKFTEASYIASIMHSQQRVSRYFNKYSLSYMNNEFSNVVNSESILSLTNSILTNDNAHKGNIILEDNENVYSSCDGLSDGYYYLQINLDLTKPIITAKCSNSYMIIDYSFDSNWESYFYSWKQAHYKVASPIKTDTLDWQNWFLPDSGSGEYNYILSPMCDSCNENSLYQTEGTSTTYWENAVNTYCATNQRGMPAGDAKWQSYTCRESIYSGVRGLDEHTHKDYVLYATFVDDWTTTDYNGIDKEVLLTALSGKNDGSLGTCLTTKQISNNEHFQSVTECEETDVGNGNLPTVGTNGEYCVCSKQQQVTSSTVQKRALVQSEIDLLLNDADTVAREKYLIQEKIQAKEEEKEKIYYLYQSDFKSGTYRIQESGTYIIMEDIVFDYNAPDYDSNEDYSANSVYSDDGDIYWYPKVSQKSEYPGAYEFHDPYLLGFFAGITIEVDDVTIDLNGQTLSMDQRYFYQQPWWSHIEIGSQAFVPGEGPSHFGATPSYVKNVEIKNGILGLTSHHCVHGTAPEASLLTNVVIKDVVCKDFITHGIQLNGFNGLKIDNVEIGPTAQMQYLTVDYSQMRTLLPRFEYFADLYGDEHTYTFGGKPSAEYIEENDLGAKVSLSNDKDYTLREILDEMVLQMDMAFDYVTERKTEDELYEEYGDKWLQSKRVFVMDSQSGIPYGGVIYGLYLNYPSSGISGFYRNSDKSYNVEVNNLYVHDITHSSLEEAYLLKSMRSVFALPIVARLWMGEDLVSGFSSVSQSEQVYYYGTIVYDWLIAYYTILKDDVNNVEATNLLYFGDSALSWTSGEGSTFTGESLSNNYLLTCNGDPMFHSVKGIFGLRVSNVKEALLNNIKIENLRELSPIGSDVCGSYQKSHDIQQQLPYLYGFTGNNIHGVSVIDSNVLFSNLIVNNLNSLTGNSTGMTVYPRATVRFDGKNNEFSNIIGGSQFLANNMDYDSLSSLVASPNQMPRGCAVKSENFEHFESRIVIESMKEEDGTSVNVECVTGYVGCDDSKYDGWTDFGTSKSSSQCDTDKIVDEIKYGVEFLNSHQSRVPLFKTSSSSQHKFNKLTKYLSLSSSVNIDSDNIVISGNNDHINGDNNDSDNNTKRVNNNNMIYIMIGVISTAVLFALCSFARSFYAQSKIQEINNQLNGYQKI